MMEEEVGAKRGGTLFPRGALVGAAALIALTVASAAVGRLAGLGSARMPESPTVESSDLRFADRSDGAVVISDARSGRIVEVIAPGTNGFLRSVMRGLARDRKRQELGTEPAFRLTRWADGRLSLDDEATGRRIDLGAFGPTNAAVFAGVLTAARSGTP
jgi:putative photosynthetic complex assembly protein